MKLHAAVDIYDEFRENDRFYESEHLRALMRELRGMGVEQVEWVVDTMWTLYEDYPGGMDLLAEAVAAAHGEGMQLHAVYKPFETNLPMFSLPETAPRPDCSRYMVDDVYGIMPIMCPLGVERPELALARREVATPADTRVAALRLLKADATVPDLAALRVRVSSSAVNGEWTRYDGPLTVTPSAEWRPWKFQPAPGCVLTIGGLELPGDHRYYRVEVDGLSVPWVNAPTDILELVNAAGEVIPHTTGKPAGPGMMQQLRLPVMQAIVPYAADPAVQAYLADEAQTAALEAGYCRYGIKAAYGVPMDLRQQGVVVAMRGAVTRAPGLMHPGYAAVRESWLATVQMCLDRGADGVNIRCSTHFNPEHPQEWGYNPDAFPDREIGDDTAAMADANAEAYTQFLREAADAAHAMGRQLGVHVMGNIVEPLDQGCGASALDCFARDWPVWIREIADYVEMRGSMGMRPATMKRVIDRLGQACREAGKPLIYQSNRRNYSLDGPYHMLQAELDWVQHHPDVAAYQLYETAYFTRLDAAGELRVGDGFRRFVADYDWD